MIKFGSSGTGILFNEEGFDKTIEVPQWMSKKGLDCYEYSFGHGVRMGEKTALTYGEEFAKYNIEISVHAPYYINFATEDNDKAANNNRYILESLQAVNNLGGNRCVFHPGSMLKLHRNEAMDILMGRMRELIALLYDKNLNSNKLAVESMGKIAQLGTVDEVIEICKLDKMLYPCIDFGHINAREQGSLKGYSDYCTLLEKLIENLGYERISDMHIHFSKIMYSQKGEIKHLDFDDNIYGPEFDGLALALIDLKLTPYIICESSNMQAVDAITMKKTYNEYLKAKQSN